MPFLWMKNHQSSFYNPLREQPISGFEMRLWISSSGLQHCLITSQGTEGKVRVKIAIWNMPRTSSAQTNFSS